MFRLINTQTSEIAFTGKSLTECKTYAIKKGLFKIERSKNFRHVICGYWNIERVK
jgi:hypothetical protein